MSVKPWDCRHWGIRFTGAGGRSMLIGASWHVQIQAAYEGEPTRALLFTTRELAREFCRGRHERYRDRTDCCAKWRFTPVRVRERVEVA